MATVNEVCSRGLAYDTHCTYHQSAAAPSHSHFHVVLLVVFYVALFSALGHSPPSRRVLCAPYNHALCLFTQNHIRRVHACLAVTCPLHFWQNGRDLLRANAVTRGWNGYRNDSQHRKLNLEKKILLPFMPGLEPATFQSRVRRSNH